MASVPDPSGESASYWTCENCGAWNATDAQNCRECGVAHGDDRVYDIQFSLSFPAAQCPGCGMPGPAGPCPHCGTPVPLVDAPAESALARRAALESLVHRSEQLLSRYDELPEPHIPIAADQYATALVDSRALKRMRLSIRYPRKLSSFDLEDSKEIGGRLRGYVRAYVEDLERIFRATEELAWFVPPSPEVARAREAMIASGRYVTEIALSVLSSLTSLSIEEVATHQARFRELLSGYPFEQELSGAMTALEALPDEGLDARISVALGVEFIATDSYGLLDPARVFAAFVQEGDPFTPLSHASVRYVSHLTAVDPEAAQADWAGLGLSVIALAALDRPLPAHRIARQASELFRRAKARDPEATARLLERTTAEGPRIFAAAKRIHDDLVYLAAGHAQDEADLVRRIVDTYKGLAESSFRAYAWLVDDASRIVAGRAVSNHERPPLLGPLEEGFRGRQDDLSQALARAVDPLVRNAQAHESYRFDPQTEELVLDDGIRISIEKFSRRFERLLAATAGLDVAIAVFALEENDDSVPTWLSEGEAPYAAELLIRGVLGAYGIEVVGLEIGNDVLIQVDAEVATERLFAPLAAVAQIASQADQIELRTTEKSLIRVERAAFREFAEADEATKDLAVIVPFYNAGLLSGGDSSELLQDVLALFVALVGGVDVPRLKVALGIGNPRPFVDLRARLTYIIDFIESRDEGLPLPAKRILGHLREARAMIPLVLKGDAHAVGKLGASLSRALDWVTQRGVTWPLV
jgi:ribosomal protein L40E